MEMLHLFSLISVFLLFAMLGVPIFLSMGFSSVVYILLFGQTLPLLVIPNNMVGMLDSFGFLAIPFFLLAGNLMNTGGITRRLVDFSTAIIGHIRGGLSHVNIVASMVFSGVSGSAVADTSAIGAVLIPSMKKEGYTASYAAAVTATSSTIGPVIPPSIPLVIYALLTEESVGKLFLGGAIPGTLMGLYLLCASYFISKKKNFPARPRASFRKILSTFFGSLFALFTPLIIILGIVLGVVTPTEAGVLAVFYALGTGLFIYRELKWRDVLRIFRNSMIESSTIMIILAASGIFSWLVASMGAGEILERFFTSISTNKWVILGILNLFFLLWGLVLDPMTAMVVIVPSMMPLIRTVGIDPVHFGVVVTINLMIALVTPPVGYLLYLSASISGARFEDIVRDSMPFLVALFVTLVCVTYFPYLTLWLPQVLMGGK